jgi:two-component system, NtrC family, nitrogen regulation sensor histidine kinase NtrY
MIHIIKNYKWIITSSLICILFGLLTFFTFTNQSFITLKNSNLQILLSIDLLLLVIFFWLIFNKSFKTLKKNKVKKIGSEVNLKYILYFSSTTLLPSVIIAFFSLILFNVGLQRYFDDKIKNVVNNSAELANNYVEQTRNSIETDILLIVLDVNNKSTLYYDSPKRFLNLLTSQRLLRRLDEVHLIDSSGNLIMSNVVDPSINYMPPSEEALNISLDGKPVRIIDPQSNRTAALVKLSNFIDTYLYIVRFMDPKVTNYLQQTGEAVSFYFNLKDSKTGIRITFAIIYLLVVSLFLFLSIIIAITFARRLTVPIVNLIGASEKISSGDLNAKVPQINTDSEITKLNENFNSMIDKLKVQQDKLLMSERHSAWESVARKLAHEIKNPLTPIQLSIDRIRDKYLKKVNDTGFSEYLETITKQIHNIEFLLNEFSDFARMPKPVMKEINLYDLIFKNLNLYKLSEKYIDFSLIKQKTTILINADEEQLNRVFINLIKNSIESINEKKIKNADFKGKINVEIKEDSDYILLTFIDNGVGFDQVDKTKMLTPYYTTKKKGTGLGLAIVTKITSDHNGTILFNSVKGGAEVKITLPKNYE